MATTLFPKLRARDAASAIEFYKKAFGAVEVGRLATPEGRVLNALLKIGGAPFTIAEEAVDSGSPAPQTLGGAGVSIDLFVDDADAVARQAVAAGAVVEFPIEDQFYGMRQGRIRDPFGHAWNITTVTEEMSYEEMQRRFDEMMK